ncbi:MAG: VWA domain-containing protein [Bermanella sp.]
MSLIDINHALDHDRLSGFKPLVNSNESILGVIKDKQFEWSKKFSMHKLCNDPYIEQYRIHEKWMKTKIDSVSQAKDMLMDYLNYCEELGVYGDEGFWNKQFYKSNDESTTTELSDDFDIGLELLRDQWTKEISEIRSNWALDALNHFRLNLISELEKLLEIFEKMFKGLESLGLEPGRWLDLSTGSLTEQDIETFKRWADYFKNDEGAQAICEKLGRLNEVEVSENIERVSVQHTIQKWVPDVNSREEIVGIKLGRDIEHALPSELALLSDAETSLLFDLKFVEGQLMSYDLQGLQQVEETVEREEDQSIEEVEEKGPMILCIDTSGSMHGEPENIAKAMALFLANKARQQDRACYLINFSTGIETLDLSGSGGLSSLIRFLSSSFHGGTDAAPALRHALSMMREQEYEKSDVLMISDFVMGGLPNDLMGGIENKRLAGNQFYSLVVGSCFMSNRLETLFDYEWVYNPSNSSITDLVNFHSKSKMFDVKEVNYV